VAEKESLGQTSRDVNAPPTKWEVYEQILCVPYYVVFDRYTNELQAFELMGNRYQKMQLEEKHLWLPEIQLGVGLWSGTYQGIDRQWLRWFDGERNWLLTTVEQEAQERQKAERLAAKLRELGVDPDEV
jgi:hypothetical protein